ncbi:malonyl-coenzyme A:anthocyanin 3-O-glucoside-6''-O-malonyltransferase-like [Rutidosis leptorrhynchoides]|uniref:malonyl-coenzyme A:anthocyanin 3-O-glucoside-6''-O-malonyltransferase-like n=1 Tax=Rutidosis leptorrhynchoides TaxID=125765 RepID=UPI003A99A8BA
MTTTNSLLTVLEKCQIGPPPNTVGDRSLPVTFFDLAWLLFHPIHQLFFYNFTHSRSHFIETIIPNLKQSLSTTLQHFFPFASNLILYPTKHDSGHSRRPEIRYTEGDSLALTFAESDLDFNDLKRNHPRECNKFHSLVPLLKDPYKVSDFVKIPMFSIQVTFFENSGITIGLTNHHTLCDASSRYDFLKAWTSIARNGTNDQFLASGIMPFYDKHINFPKSLDDVMVNIPAVQNLDEKYKVPQLVNQGDRVRATFVLKRSEINVLKKWVLVQLPSLPYISSFVLGCGFVWSCVAKSRVQVEGKKGEYEIDRYMCVADFRRRLDPPLPQTYFGNCVGPCFASTSSAVLIGKDGFVTAVELIQKGINETVKNNDVFKDAETWMERAMLPVPTIGVAGTPKLNVYEVDFGWGKPEKYETISLDYSYSISVNAGKDSPDDLEIGLCLPAKQMDAFLAISRHELENILGDQK